MIRLRSARRVLFVPLALLLGALLVLTGCGELTPGSPRTPKPTAAPKKCSEQACPELTSPAGDIEASGVTPANAASTVPAYLKSVLDDLDVAWQGWFSALNIGEASAGRQLIGPGARFTTRCEDADGATLTMTSDFPNALYCALDPGRDGQNNERTGSVILPETTFADIWDGKLMGQRGVLLGDFSAATIVAHEYGHNVMYRLAEAYGLSDAQLPGGNNAELLADCFAGNWGKTVFARDDLSAKEMAQAVVLMVSVSDPAPGMGHGTIPERVAAISRGFGKTGAGTPGTCLGKYWPEVLAPA